MSDQYLVEIECRAKGTDVGREEFFDEISENLDKIVGVVDADLGANLADGLYHFTMYVDSARGPGDAIRQALAAVRTAWHASGGCTAGWDQIFQEVGQSARLAELVG